jgi:hypothetical protein
MKNSKTRKRAKPQPRKAAAKKPARKPQPKAARPPRRRVPQGSLTIRSATGGYSTAIEVRKGEDLQDAARRVLGQDRRWLEEIEVGKRHRTEFGDIEGWRCRYGERGAIMPADRHHRERRADRRRAADEGLGASAQQVPPSDPIPVHVITIDSIVAGEWDENATARTSRRPRRCRSSARSRSLPEGACKGAPARPWRHRAGPQGCRRAEDKGFARPSERAAALTGKKRRTLEKAEAVVDGGGKGSGAVRQAPRATWIAPARSTGRTSG